MLVREKKLESEFLDIEHHIAQILESSTAQSTNPSALLELSHKIGKVRESLPEAFLMERQVLMLAEIEIKRESSPASDVLSRCEALLCTFRSLMRTPEFRELARLKASFLGGTQQKKASPLAAGGDKSLRILVVEDDFVSRRVLAKLLKNIGSVDVAINGKEAVEAFVNAKFNHQGYDLVCLDLSLPLLNGHEVLKRIREAEAKEALETRTETKVIITTASEDAKDIMCSFKEGCEGYLTKPIDHAKLEKLLQKLQISTTGSLDATQDL